MQKSLFLIILLFQPVFASSESQLVSEANELLDEHIDYYLLKAHELHVAQVKVLREKGIKLYNLKNSGTDKEKLKFLLSEKQKTLSSLKNAKKSKLKDVQLKLVSEKVKRITQSLEHQKQIFEGNPSL